MGAESMVLRETTGMHILGFHPPALKTSLSSLSSVYCWRSLHLAGWGKRGLSLCVLSFGWKRNHVGTGHKSPHKGFKTLPTVPTDPASTLWFSCEWAGSERRTVGKGLGSHPNHF